MSILVEVTIILASICIIFGHRGWEISYTLLQWSCPCCPWEHFPDFLFFFYWFVCFDTLPAWLRENRPGVWIQEPRGFQPGSRGWRAWVKLSCSYVNTDALLSQHICPYLLVEFCLFVYFCIRYSMEGMV